MKLYFKFVLFLSVFLLPNVVLPVAAFESNSVVELFEKVEGLSLSRKGYTLGAVLDDGQKKITQFNPVSSDTAKTYKFQR